MSQINQTPIVFANFATNVVAGVVQLTGDLGGTYLDPKVVKLNGATLPVSAGSAGQTLVVQNDGSLAWATALKRLTAITYASTISPNVGTTDIGRVVLTGNVTVANPTGTPTVKQYLQLEFIQDATGGRTATFGTAYAFSTDIPAPTLSTGAAKVDIVSFQYDTASGKYRCVGVIKGF